MSTKTSFNSISRRAFLKGTAVVGGGLFLSRANMLPGRRLQDFQLPDLTGVTLEVMQNASFIPEWDDFFLSQIVSDFEVSTGAKVNISFVAENQLSELIAAAVQAGDGPDVMMTAHNWGHIFAPALVDLSDLAEQVKVVTGPFYPQHEAYSNVDGVYRTIPHHYLGIVMLYRKSWFDEIGVTEFPETWEELFAAGEQLKAQGRPLGQSLGHSINDPHLFSYPFLWSYGGREVDENGQVAINSPETIEAVRTLAEWWPRAFDEAGLAWDDSGNNRAILAETASVVLNATSPWWVAKNQGLPVYEDIAFGLYPSGPAGRFSQGVAWSYGIPNYSDKVDAAKAFIQWTLQPRVWTPAFALAQGFYNGVGPLQNENPIWNTFPESVQIIKAAPESSQGIGYMGPSSAAAGVAKESFIIVDMFARAVQGEAPEAAVAWAENELKRIYGQS